jgi:dGTPase
MKNLAHLSFKSENTLGRFLPVKEDRDRNLYFMDPYLLDQNKILCSKAIRRLKDKTQVLSGLGNVYIRDRLVHSFEVMALAVQSGARLGLNINLLQAGSLGHDIWHVPFGHLGERFLTSKLGEKFRHEKFAIFGYEVIERNGAGLNLSYETLQAIKNHSRGSGKMVTLDGDVLEDDVIMICDKLAYVFSDFNDISRINYGNFVAPKEMFSLGSGQAERLNSCLQAFWRESLKKGKISFCDSDEAKKFMVVRDFMYEEVYHKIDQLEDRVRMNDILEKVYSYFLSYFNDERSAVLAIAISSENDIYALNGLLENYGKVVVDNRIKEPKNFSIGEVMHRIPNLAKFDFCNPSKYMDKNNFGKFSKMELFIR